MADAVIRPSRPARDPGLSHALHVDEARIHRPVYEPRRGLPTIAILAIVLLAAAALVALFLMLVY